MKTIVRVALFSCFSLFLQTALGQNDSKESALLAALKKANGAEEKVNACYELADLYFESDHKKSDSIAFLGLTIAEASRDRRLIVSTNLNNANRFLQKGTEKSNLQEALQFAQKALVLSRADKDPELIIRCYNFLARIHRNDGGIVDAIQANKDAIALLPEIQNDSLKIVTYNNFGLTLLHKKDMVSAFKAYLDALTIAEQSNKPVLLLLCYEKLVDFYQSLGDYEKAKDYAFKILNEHLRTQQKVQPMYDYFRIANVYAGAKDYKMANFYYDKSMHLADSLKDPNYKINVKLSIVNMYLNNNLFREGYDVIKKSPEIFAYIQKIGMSYEIDKANGYIQMKLGHYDSSIYYYRKVESFYNTKAGPMQRYFYYTQYAMLWKEMKQWDKAIACQQKAKEAIEGMGDIENLSDVVHSLDSLYLFKGDFTTAYRYHQQYQTLRDSLQKLSKEKDLQSLEIDNENKRKERAQLQADEDLRRRHNLQYMAITVSIGGIFILLVAIGLFRVSPGVVKAMGFFAFIFLFEFIILIADNQIHHLTHGEPWKVLLIKIFLVAILLPFHHWLEEKVIHYLIEKRLVITQQLRKIIPTQSKERT